MLVDSPRLTALLIVGSLVASPGAGMPSDGIRKGAQTASALEPSVSSVATGGIWEDGGRYGRYRVIVITAGFEHSGTYVYAQWLWVDESTQRLVELVTEPIEAINERFASVVQNVRFNRTLSSSGKGVFELVLNVPLPEREERASVTLRSPGDFEVSSPNQPDER